MLAPPGGGNNAYELMSPQVPSPYPRLDDSAAHATYNQHSFLKKQMPFSWLCLLLQTNFFYGANSRQLTLQPVAAAPSYFIPGGIAGSKWNPVSKSPALGEGTGSGIITNRSFRHRHEKRALHKPSSWAAPSQPHRTIFQANATQGNPACGSTEIICSKDSNHRLWRNWLPTSNVFGSCRNRYNWTVR